jgi:hypothetical protein
MRPRYLIALFSLALALAVPSVSNAATLTFTSPNCSDFTVTSNNGNVTLNCVPINNNGSGAPSNCSLSASTSSVPQGGGNVTLTASCSGGGAPTAYTWSGGNVATSTTSGQQTVNVTATTTFFVTPANASGSGNSAQTTVTVSTGGGDSSGGGNSQNLCPASGVTRLTVPWGGQADTRSSGTAFGGSGILVVSFTVPASAAYGFGSLGAVSVSEFGDPPVYRQASLSTSQCDFRGVATGRGDRYTKDITGQSAFPMAWAVGNTATASFTVTGQSALYPQLQPGKTYYFNIRNWSPFNNGGDGGSSCLRGSCNVIVHVSTPG